MIRIIKLNEQVQITIDTEHWHIIARDTETDRSLVIEAWNNDGKELTYSIWNKDKLEETETENIEV